MIAVRGSCSAFSRRSYAMLTRANMPGFRCRVVSGTSTRARNVPVCGSTVGLVREVVAVRVFLVVVVVVVLCGVVRVVCRGRGCRFLGVAVGVVVFVLVLVVVCG